MTVAVACLVVGLSGGASVAGAQYLGPLAESFGPEGRTPTNFRDLPASFAELSLAASPQGDVFVQQGTVIRRFAFNGDPVGSRDVASLTSKLSGIAADSAANVYAADPVGGRVLKFSPQGVLLDQWPGHGDGAAGTLGEGACPSGIAVDASGNVYVTCARGGWFEKLSPSGSLLLRRASCHSGPIAAAADGSIYVTSCESIRLVLHYGPTGDYRGTIGKARALGGREDLPAKAGEFGPWRPPHGLFVGGGATGLAVDASGALWVADPDNRRLQIFNATGTVVNTCRPGSFNQLQVVAAGRPNEAYASDYARVHWLGPIADPQVSCDGTWRSLTLPDRRLKLARDRTVRIRVGCGSAGEPCTGRIRISQALKTGARRRIATKRFELPGAREARIPIRLSRRTARRIRRLGSVRILVALTVDTLGGKPTLTRKTFKLTAR